MTSVNATVPPKVVKRGQKFPPALFSGWRQIRQASKAMNFNWRGQSHTNMYNYCYMQLYQLNWVYSEQYTSAMADQFCAAHQFTSTAYTTKCGHIQLCQPPQLGQYNQVNTWGHSLGPKHSLAAFEGRHITRCNAISGWRAASLFHHT